MNKPKKLKLGDRIALIAPSSPTNRIDLEKAIASVNQFGFKTVAYPSCYASHGHISGTDEVRAKDVNDAFADDSIAGIICLRGGYGTPRILDKLDYEIVKKHPKVFLGYSDITALHIAFNKLSDLITLHGTMPSPAWANGLDEYTINHLKRALLSNQPLGQIDNPANEPIITLVDGVASGKLVGGNLSLIVCTLGTPYEIDTKGNVLLIEDVDESNYKIDGMLNSLRLAGKFKDASGIILGTFSRCNPEAKSSGFADLDLMTIFEELVVTSQKPTILNFRAGHNYPQPTLPLGAEVTLNATQKIVVFNQAHFSDKW